MENKERVIYDLIVRKCNENAHKKHDLQSMYIATGDKSLLPEIAKYKAIADELESILVSWPIDNEDPYFKWLNEQ